MELLPIVGVKAPALIDMTVRDYGWNATKEGSAYHAAKDQHLAEFLARAESARKVQSL